MSVAPSASAGLQNKSSTTSSHAVEMRVRYQGNLRCKAQHRPSKTNLTTDAPVDNHGLGESFSPTDLVAAALASCMLTIMGICAKKLDVSLAGTKSTVFKEMTATPPRRIAKISIHFMLPDVAAEHRAALERAAHACPVKLSLHPDVAQEVVFGWGEA